MGSEEKRLEEKIEKANVAYRKGNPIMSDIEYDRLLDELERINPQNPLLDKVGFNIDEGDARKQKLPIRMASMNKIKNMEELNNWLERKGISRNEYMVITPKYDGISLLVEDIPQIGHRKAWTRGDGKEGQFIPKHYAKVPQKRGLTLTNTHKLYVYGELIMSREKFKKYDILNGGDYKNARNLVSGKANDKKPSEILHDCTFIAFGADSLEGDFRDEFGNMYTKSADLSFLNSNYNIQHIPYKVMKASDITEDFLYNIFKEWNKDFEIDGVIIEVNSHKRRKELGRETGSGNPCYARAFKGEFEDVEETTCTGVSWQISKRGFMKPVIHIDPVRLNGAMVTNIYGDNARWMVMYGIGEGTKLSVKRSGMVIPRITKVWGQDVADVKYFNKIMKGAENMSDVTKTEIERLRGALGYVPEKDNFEFPENGGWDGVELLAKGQEGKIQQQRMVAFFEVLGIDFVSDKTVEFLWDKGYRTIADILSIQPKTMQQWEGWGEKKAKMVYNSIHSKLKDVPVEKIQHASGLFYGLGTKKLALVRHFSKPGAISWDTDITEVEGFSEKSAKIFLDGLPKFQEWVNDLPVTIKYEEDEKETLSDTFSGWAVVFSGFRDKEMEEKIELHGGEIKSGVSKKVTHLVMKQTGSGSSKERKAKKYGITIVDRGQMEVAIKKAEKKS